MTTANSTAVAYMSNDRFHFISAFIKNKTQNSDFPLIGFYITQFNENTWFVQKKKSIW